MVRKKVAGFMLARNATREMVKHRTVKGDVVVARAAAAIMMVVGCSFLRL
jgi:hypothetical protein